MEDWWRAGGGSAEPRAGAASPTNDYPVEDNTCPIILFHKKICQLEIFLFLDFRLCDKKIIMHDYLCP